MRWDHVFGSFIPKVTLNGIFPVYSPFARLKNW